MKPKDKKSEDEKDKESKGEKLDPSKVFGRNKDLKDPRYNPPPDDDEPYGSAYRSSD